MGKVIDTWRLLRSVDVLAKAERGVFIYTWVKLVPQTAPWSYTQAADGDGQRQRYRAVQSDTNSYNPKPTGSTRERRVTTSKTPPKSCVSKSSAVCLGALVEQAKISNLLYGFTEKINNQYKKMWPQLGSYYLLCLKKSPMGNYASAFKIIIFRSCFQFKVTVSIAALQT